MNVSKVLVASTLYPFLYFRKTLNAVTLPFLIFTFNWVLGAKVAESLPNIGWLSVVVQMFALAMLLVNCVALILNHEFDSISDRLKYYVRAFFILAALNVAIFFLSYILVLILINMLSIQGLAQFQIVHSFCDAISSSLLFWLFMIVPNLVSTGKFSVKKVIPLVIGARFKLFLVSIVYQLAKIVPEMITGLTESSLVGYTMVFAMFVIQTIGCFLIAFSFLAIHNTGE